jgi:cation/acetate symporter
LKKPLTDEDLLERASIDGRVAFAVTAFALGAGLVALIDRLGAPERFIAIFGPIAALTGLAAVGLLVRTTRVSRFYAAGRSVPAVYAGLALACLAGGLFLPYLPPEPTGTSLTGLLVGFGAGFALAALAVGPFVRKTGAFSIPDLIASRFPSRALRLGLVTVIAAIGALIGLAGFETAIRSLINIGATNRGTASLLIGFVLLLIVVPGGVTGVVWTATGAAGILLAGLGLPLIVLALRGAALPSPLFGDSALWRQALARMAEWHAPAAPADDSMAYVLVVAIAIGVAALAPLLSPAIACRDSGAARRAGIAAVVWSGALIALVAISMAATSVALDGRLTGQRADRLPDFAYAASAKGLVQICGGNVGRPAEALEACRAAPGSPTILRAEDIVVDGAWLAIGLPAARGLSVALSGLMGVAFVAIAMMIAASGFQTFATAVGHDAFYRVRDASALTSRRLATTRLAAVVGVIAAIAIVWLRAPDPRALTGLAIAFSTAALAPLLALALWPRAGGADATLALLVGLATAEAVIVTGGGPPSLERLAASAVAACVCGFCAGFISSLFRAGGPESVGGAFVQHVLHGEQDALNPDKGA